MQSKYVTGSRRWDLILFWVLTAAIVITGFKRLRVYHRADTEAERR